jgi:hypothetical protein
MADAVGSIPPGYKVVSHPPSVPEGYKVVSDSDSVMNPDRPGILKRIGKAVTDPTTIAKTAVGVGIPLAAQAALGPEAGPLARTAIQGLAGAITPYAQYLTGEAMGEKLPPPSVRDALHSAAFNAGMAGLGEVIGSTKGTVAAVKPEMESAPKTINQLNQAVRNRGFWKSQGMDDDKITSILALPESEKDTLAQQILAGREYKGAFQNVVDNTRKDFTTRYDAAYGAQKAAAVDPKDIAAQMRQVAGGQAQHELTLTFQKFLLRKADEIDPPPGLKSKAMEPGMAAQIEAQHAGITDRQKLLDIAKAARDKAKAGPSFTVQEARDLNTELRENVPGQATNLDLKVAGQLQDLIKNKYEQGIRDAGGTSEQIGALRGIDEDYGRFQEMLKTLDPRDEKYGSKVADALFDPMLKNPAAGQEFIAMAKAADRAHIAPDMEKLQQQFNDAFAKGDKAAGFRIASQMHALQQGVDSGGIMDKLREAFTTRALEKSSRGATPVNQMEILNTLEKQWGENGSRSVLSGLFGKNSPWADPATFAKTLAVPVDEAKLTGLAAQLKRAGNAAYIIRAAAIVGFSGGSMFAMYQHPERIPEILGAMASLAIGARLMGRLDSAGQRAYVNWRLNPKSADNFKNFMRASGAMIGATTEMPNQTPNP